MKNNKLILTLGSFLACVAACGGGGGSSGLTFDNSANEIDTEKLIGTPFEGMTIGDDIPEYQFVCDQYQTLTIDQFPIQIFAAFFTPNEEITIQEGIDIANEGIGFTAYELTDVWEDNLRVIFRVSDDLLSSIVITNNALGLHQGLRFGFNNKNYSDNISVDWSILISDLSSVSKYVLAHELGHASGIHLHKLIDYENDDLLDLELASLMGGPDEGGIALTDYNFMMQKQGEIMTNHLGDSSGEQINDPCTNPDDENNGVD